MAENGGCRVGIQAFHEMQVRVAKAGIRRAQQDLAPLRPFNLDLLDGQRLVGRVEDRCSHFGSLR